MSLSARRAWIEIGYFGCHCQNWVSLSARRAWIEMFDFPVVPAELTTSLSARRAWIEIRHRWASF